MKLSVINTGFFKLDGGAMFGVVPKSLWSRLETPDENNLCTWAMRCLLIETEGRKVLVDTGIGNKQSAKFFSHFEPHGADSLVASLRQAGVGLDEVTDVLLTHLHFDHVGGAVQRTDTGALEPLFPNATYWTNQAHYDWAYTPNDRENASFLKENFVPLQEAGVLKMVEALPYDQRLPWMAGIELGYAYGHTEAMMLPIISYKGKTIVYCADLLPSTSHIGMPYVMGYDIRPMNTLQEKKHLLTRAVEEDYILFFEHAKAIEACTVKRNAKGRIVADQMGSLAMLLEA